MKNKTKRLVYYRLYDGQIIKESDSEAQNLLIDYNIFITDLFKNRNLKIKTREKIGKNTFLVNLFYGSEVFNIVLLNIKNSGLKSEDIDEKNMYLKRLQISNKINFSNSNDIYTISVYNVGDKRLYFFENLTVFIQKALLGHSYSSRWIEFKEIKKTYDDECNFFADSQGRKIRAFTDKKIKSISDYDFINKVLIGRNYVLKKEQLGDDFNDLSSGVSSCDDVYLIKKFDLNNESFISSTKLQRDNKIRDAAIKRANNTCEYCGSRSFNTQSGTPYFCGHHIIMYNKKVQLRYKYCLDYIENICCLCPDCHAKIHNADNDTKREMVMTLLTRHKNLLHDFKINDVRSILEDYFKGVTDDE